MVGGLIVDRPLRETLSNRWAGGSGGGGRCRGDDFAGVQPAVLAGGEEWTTHQQGHQRLGEQEHDQEVQKGREAEGEREPADRTDREPIQRSSREERYAEGYSRYDRGDDRGYSRYSDDGQRSYGRSRRYVREASYERGYSNGDGGERGRSQYSGGYATLYR